MLGCSNRALASLLLGWLFAFPVIAEQVVKPKFNRDIRPLLADRCFSCHGPDAEAREADLRLDDRQAAMAAGVFSLDVDESELWQRITSGDDDYRMPPARVDQATLPSGGIHSREKLAASRC